jgi:hypothetical protein
LEEQNLADIAKKPVIDEENHTSLLRRNEKIVQEVGRCTCSPDTAGVVPRSGPPRKRMDRVTQLDLKG